MSRWSPLLPVVILAACVPVEDAPELAETGEELFGAVRTNSCTSAEQTLLGRAMAWGRTVARTPAFEQCIRQAMAGGLVLNGSQIGPYVGCDGDPADLSVDTLLAT